MGPVLTIVPGVEGVVDNLIVTGGASTDPIAIGGIWNQGHLELTRSKAAGNEAMGSIGATGGLLSGPPETAAFDDRHVRE